MNGLSHAGQSDSQLLADIIINSDGEGEMNGR